MSYRLPTFSSARRANSILPPIRPVRRVEWVRYEIRPRVVTRSELVQEYSRKVRLRNAKGRRDFKKKYVKGIERFSTSCSICIDNFDKDHDATQLPCGHYFHTLCLTKWKRIKKICPMCRRSFK